ncbi:hypothetical protein FRB98_002516, partial [Tulasnella sp. 332]
MPQICLPGTTTISSTTSKATTTSTTTKATTTSTTTKATTSSTSTSSAAAPTGTQKFKYFGVSESCAEFGTAWPGVLNTDYTWPAPSSIDYFTGAGFNFFRVP